MFIEGMPNAYIKRQLLTKDNALSFADAFNIVMQLKPWCKEDSKLTSNRIDTHFKSVSSRKNSSKASQDSKTPRK